MAEVEVDKVLGLCAEALVVSGPRNLNMVQRSSLHTVGYEAAEVAAHNAVPSRALPLIEL